MATCNELSIDMSGLYAVIQKACKNLLDDVAERVQQEFGPLIYQDGAGRHEWRSNAAQEFQKISESITNDLIEVKLGLRTGIE